MTWEAVAEDLGIKASRSTIHREFKAAEYKRYSARHKPYLDDRMKELRLEWAWAR